MWHVYLAFALMIITVVVIAVIFMLLPERRRTTTIPGPEPLDYLEGNFPDISSSGSLYEFLRNLHHHYGPLASFWWGPRLAVSVASPQLFKKHSEMFDRPVELFRIFEPLIGRGSIKLSNGPGAQKGHEMYTRCFTKGRMKQQMTLLSKLSREFAEKWSRFPPGDHIPLREECMTFSIKALLQATMGTYFRDTDQLREIQQAHDYVISEMEKCLVNSVPGSNNMATKQFDQKVQFIRNTFKDCLDRRKSSQLTEQDDLVIDAAIKLGLTEDITVSDLLTFFVEGFYSAALLLTWSFYYLAKHQDIQDKLYSEIKQVLEDKEMNENDLEQLVYLQQLLYETLRCSLHSPITGRVHGTDTEVNGHRIPAGTPIIHCIGAVFQDPEIFPEPERFDPERFSQHNCQRRPELAFKLFGFAGNRTCPGKNFAMLEAKIVLSDMLRTFKLSLIDEKQEISPVFRHVTYPSEEIWISVHKRKC